MATLRAFTRFNVTDLDLNYYSREFFDSGLEKDSNLTLNGVIYPDYYWVEARDGEDQFELSFLGTGFAANGQGVITGGTVTAVGEVYLNNSNYLWYMQGVSVSAAAIYNAALTDGSDDERALFATALSGDDTIILSEFDDIMLGFAGNDLIAGGPGDDLLDGGEGTDTAIYAADFSSVTVLIVDGAVGINTPDEGTDTLINFEFFRFGSEVRSLASLMDKTAPVLQSFTPADGASSVAVDANLRLTFSEAIAKGTGTLALRSGSASGTIVESFDIATSSRLTINGAMLTIDPTANLNPGTTYFVTYGSGVIKDLNGNAAAALSTYDFTTAAPVPPPPADDWRLRASDGFAGEIGGQGQAYGTIGFQDIRILDVAGTVTLDNSFNRGGDVVRLFGLASSWDVARSGSNAIFSSGDTEVVIPMGTQGLAVVFADGARLLRYDTASATARIGSQTFGETEATVSAATDGTAIPTGAVANAIATIEMYADGEVTAGGKLDIYGALGDERITLTRGEASMDSSFNKGGDTLVIDMLAQTFEGMRSGSNLVLDGETLDVELPVGTAGMDIVFTGSTRELVYVPAQQQMLLGNQVIGFVADTLSIA